MISTCFSTFTPRRQRELPTKSRVALPVPFVVATSAAVKPEHVQLMYGRKLCANRRGFFDHLAPNALIYNTLRITTGQVMLISSNYWNDEIKATIDRDNKVNNGIMTQNEADQEGFEWSKREWPKRWEGIYERMCFAMAKYHAITFVMRVYEKIAESFVDTVMLDKMTLDIVDYARRGSAAGTERGDMSIEMVKVSYASNLIYYLADFSVHFVILMYSVYQYKYGKEARGRPATAIEKGNGQSVSVLCTKKTVALAFSRYLQLCLGSLGGGFGTLIRPGLGTLGGFNMADSFAIGFSDTYMDTSPFDARD